MTTLREAVADWRAECAALDAVLDTLDEAGWHEETPAVGWDTMDTVGHLADTNDLMYDSVTGGTRDLMSAVSEWQGDGGDVARPDAVDVFTAWQIERVRKMEWPEVYEWWKASVAKMVGLLESLDPSKRYRWGPNMITPLSLASARMMETWAHSLDVHEAAGVAYVDTDRIRHIAFLGHRALPYAFGLEALDAPGPVRLQLSSPSGEPWELGPADASTVIRGTASDWCRVVARRDRDGAAGRLQGEGPDAANAIKHGRAFL